MTNTSSDFQEPREENSNKIKRVTKEEILSHEVAKLIKNEHRIIFCKGQFYEYRDGYYQPLEQIEVKKWVQAKLLADYKLHRANEIIQLLENDSHIKLEQLNNTELLNLKNGLLDTENLDLLPHSPDVFSTVQLPVNYVFDAPCPKWTQTINEIFEGNEVKINLFQEYFGLCLTKITTFEKALFCVGEGANGKSTVTSILEEIVGKKNYSCIPLEKFSESHYVANFFGKLVNISGETNAKSVVQDSIFKSVISGDAIEADRKFKDPFNFKPFCKLIFAVNTLPRVEDKSNGFFRRVLILRFNKQFYGTARNKNLKNELLQELDGIFFWAIEGLKSLEHRGYFEEDSEIEQELSEYRKENNNVLVYFEENCLQDENSNIPKNKLYESYCLWCERSGYKSLNISKFGKELKKQYPFLHEDRNSAGRYWVGISFKNE